MTEKNSLVKTWVGLRVWSRSHFQSEEECSSAVVIARSTGRGGSVFIVNIVETGRVGSRQLLPHCTEIVRQQNGRLCDSHWSASKCATATHCSRLHPRLRQLGALVYLISLEFHFSNPFSDLLVLGTLQPPFCPLYLYFYNVTPYLTAF